jgi:hypothetical protein
MAQAHRSKGASTAARRPPRRPGPARSAMAAQRVVVGERPSDDGFGTTPRGVDPETDPEAAPLERSPSDGLEAPAAPLCSFALCPICMTLTALGEARPELITHVLLASREVLLALRAVIDARLEGTVTDGPATRLERLTIS